MDGCGCLQKSAWMGADICRARGSVRATLTDNNHPARNAFNFGNKKKSHGARSGEYGGVRQNSYFFFLQKHRNYCGGMSWGIVM